jgi:hypothetical protein
VKRRVTVPARSVGILKPYDAGDMSNKRTMEDALQLVHLYAERGSPKFEKAAMRWLERLPRRWALGSHAPEAVERAAVGRALPGKPIRRHEKAGGRRWVVRAI